MVLGDKVSQKKQKRNISVKVIFFDVNKKITISNATQRSYL